VQGWFPAGDRLLLRTDIYPREADLLSLLALTGVKRKLAEHTEERPCRRMALTLP
jgi:hypothetical protein